MLPQTPQMFGTEFTCFSTALGLAREQTGADTKKIDVRFSSR